MVSIVSRLHTDLDFLREPISCTFELAVGMEGQLEHKNYYSSMFPTDLDIL